MRTYSVFFVDPHDRAGLSRDLIALNDDKALEEAQQCYRSGAVEVWDGQRLVGRIESSGEVNR